MKLIPFHKNPDNNLFFGVADFMYENDCASYQNPCRDVAMQRLYIWIHTAIHQRLFFGTPLLLN
ncbi:hypothetical protein H6G93_07420 [Nostoc sp. FACHB-973]|nr:hypothetical protein [Nostoc sp. FACHB-973]